jgi:hypothetical protein
MAGRTLPERVVKTNRASFYGSQDLRNVQGSAQARGGRKGGLAVSGRTMSCVDVGSIIDLADGKTKIEDEEKNPKQWTTQIARQAPSSMDLPPPSV